MTRLVKSFCVLSVAMFVFAASLNAQQPTAAPLSAEESYTKVINERAAKIVAGLGITDAAKAARVQLIIADQYRAINSTHDARKAAAEAAKTQYAGDKTATDAAVKKIEDETMAKLAVRHDIYLKQLGAELNETQIEQVKNGMTYGVMPNTYKVYMEMLPDLTDEQKSQVYTWLKEAREFAMDAESSDKKHWWFGKYKGKINNYLSKAGYDMKKAGEDFLKKNKG